jgi:hypothetical protein
VPRQSRSSRTRARSRRTALPMQPIAATPTVAEDIPAAPAAAPRATVVRPRTTPGTVGRAFVTDYAYVIGELKRILLLTAVIVALMLILWLVLG